MNSSQKRYSLVLENGDVFFLDENRTKELPFDPILILSRQIMEPTMQWSFAAVEEKDTFYCDPDRFEEINGLSNGEPWAMALLSLPTGSFLDVLDNDGRPSKFLLECDEKKNITISYNQSSVSLPLNSLKLALSNLKKWWWWR